MLNHKYNFLDKITMTPLCLWTLVIGVFLAIRISIELSDDPNKFVFIGLIIVEVLCVTLFIMGYQSTNLLFNKGIEVNGTYTLIRNSVFDKLLATVHYEVNGQSFSKKMTISKMDVHDDGNLRLLVHPNNHKKFIFLLPSN